MNIRCGLMMHLVKGLTWTLISSTALPPLTNDAIHAFTHKPMPLRMMQSGVQLQLVPALLYVSNCNAANATGRPTGHKSCRCLTRSLQAATALPHRMSASCMAASCQPHLSRLLGSADCCLQLTLPPPLPPPPPPSVPALLRPARYRVAAAAAAAQEPHIRQESLFSRLHTMAASLRSSSMSAPRLRATPVAAAARLPLPFAVSCGDSVQ